MQEARSSENGDHKEEEAEEPPPLVSLNHVSRLCKSVEVSVDFYEKVLGFVLVNRPPAFDFDDAWLFNHGIGIHLVQKKNKDEDTPDASRDVLDPMDNHISFQCENIEEMEKRLPDMKIKYIKRSIGSPEDGSSPATIDQIFFNDPDGFMIEMCNCENLKLVPAGSSRRIKLPAGRHVPPVDTRDGQD